MSDVNIEFDRAVAGGYEPGDRVTVARSEYIDGLIAAGLAHELDDGDIDPAVPGSVPVLVEPYDDVTVEDLAAELGRRGLVKTGVKADLIDRLRDHDQAGAVDLVKPDPS